MKNYAIIDLDKCEVVEGTFNPELCTCVLNQWGVDVSILLSPILHSVGNNNGKFATVDAF